MLSAEGRVGWRGVEPALTYLDVVCRGEGGACFDQPWCCVSVGWRGWSLLWPTLMFCEGEGLVEERGAYSDLPWCCVERGGWGWSLLWPTLMLCEGWVEPALTNLDVVCRGEGWVEGGGDCSDLPWCCVPRRGGGWRLLWPTLMLCAEGRRGWMEVETVLTYLDVVCRGEEGVEGGGTCSGHHCWFCPKAGGRGWDSNSSGVGISTWPRTWPGQKNKRTPFYFKRHHLSR